MLPRVVLHNAVSADGRTTGFAADLPLLRSLASEWQPDVTLAGSDSILAALLRPESRAQAAPAAGPATSTLAVVDSRGRVKDWRRVKGWPGWRRFLSIGSEATPPEHLAYLRYQDVDALTAGSRRVDLAAALEALFARYDARTVCVDSGGALNAALFSRGLVNEVSLLVHPVVVGGNSPHTIYRSLDLAAAAPLGLRLRDSRRLDGGYVWLLYEVAGGAP